MISLKIERLISMKDSLYKYINYTTVEPIPLRVQYCCPIISTTHIQAVIEVSDKRNKSTLLCLPNTSK